MFNKQILTEHLFYVRHSARAWLTTVYIREVYEGERLNNSASVQFNSREQRTDVMRWDIIKHQIMNAKCGKIPEKESFRIVWKRFLKDVLNFSLKVTYNICITGVQQA